MQFNYLKDFSKRMQSVGRYAVLMDNSFQKTTWKQFHINSIDEQINMIFSVLLYIMECSLKEEDCTMDDISGFLGTLNDLYYKRPYTYENLKQLADFMVNTILCNSGSPMYFKGFDYEHRAYKEINVSYLGNRIIYQENGVRRTSYFLTDEGYNMMLSTLELENNLKLTVHEMLFKLHLEKADYGKAVNDIKDVFEDLRRQNQKIQEAMNRIRKNALAYSIEEYRQIVEENIDTLEHTREKFKAHREVVEKRTAEYEENSLNDRKLDEKDRESMENLKIISGYLNKALDEHQRILAQHFDLKSLYDMELENYTNMTMVQRFHFGSEVYERVLEDARLLEQMDVILKPLLFHKPGKHYNPNKALEYQKKIRKTKEDEDTLEMGFDEEEYRKEKEKKQLERLEKYKTSVSIILEQLEEYKEISLAELRERVYPESAEQLIPTLEIFREIIIEFLSAQELDMEELKKERSEFILEQSLEFQLKQMVVELVEEKNLKNIHKIYSRRLESEKSVYFENLKNENNEVKNLKCSNVKIWCE